MSENWREVYVMLSTTFNAILRHEEKALHALGFKDLTSNELHTIQAISQARVSSMGEIARAMGVALATLTTTMDRLEKKGYIVRERTSKDRRVVIVELTEKGQLANVHHEEYHRNMVDSIMKEMQPKEIELLTQTAANINAFVAAKAQNK